MKRYVKLFESWRLDEAEEGASIDLKKLKIGEFFKLDTNAQLAVLKSILDGMVKTGIIEAASEGGKAGSILTRMKDGSPEIYITPGKRGGPARYYRYDEDANKSLLDRSIFELLFSFGSSNEPIHLFLYLTDRNIKDDEPQKLYMFDFDTYKNSPAVKSVSDSTVKPISGEVASKLIGPSSSVAASAQKELDIALKGSKQKEA